MSKCGYRVVAPAELTAVKKPDSRAGADVASASPIAAPTGVGHLCRLISEHHGPNTRWHASPAQGCRTSDRELVGDAQGVPFSLPKRRAFRWMGIFAGVDIAASSGWARDGGRVGIGRGRPDRQSDDNKSK